MSTTSHSKKPGDRRLIPSPSQIVDHLDQFIIGQDHAKRTLASACYCHAFACATTTAQSATIWPDNNVLISGPSGSGKSELVRTLTKFLRIPCHMVDCSQLTPSGYKGQNIQGIIDDMESQLVGEHIAPSACILVWDEIDKLRSTASDAGEYKRMTQTDMLRLIEGAKTSGSLNSSRILHIGMGAFDGIEDLVRPTCRTIGFSENVCNDGDWPAKNEKVLPEHYISYGLIPELVGRFARFSTMSPLTVENMSDIILKSKISYLRRKVSQYEKHGAKLVFSDAAVADLAQRSLGHPSGARGLKQILTEALEPWDFQLADMRSKGISEIHYDKDAIIDGTKARVVMGNPQAPLQVGMPDFVSTPRMKEEDDHEDLFVF